MAVEVCRRFGTGGVVLLNHDIHPNSEDQDIKRFKQEVADYLGVPITYANMAGWDAKDQFDVVVEAKAFKVGNGPVLCTSRMKTEPFHAYLKSFFPVAEGEPRRDCVVYYGYDAKETKRIQRRSSTLGVMGYHSDYPLALWQRTIQSTAEIGILPPLVYSERKHANCAGCLKAKKQHWYWVWCRRPDVWARARWAEDEIVYSIIPGIYLEELEPLFRDMQTAGIEPTERISPSRFWANAKRTMRIATAMKRVGQLALLDWLAEEDTAALPCECVI